MKQKNIYSLLLICFLGLLSSANQTNKDCGEETCCLAAKLKCSLQGQKAEKADANLVPLNLFLFDL